jgi:coupling of ubiquitin conjugation to ER degradation protein 1
MADEQVSFTSIILLLALGGLVIRYIFFPPAESAGANRARDAAANARTREAAMERIQQMFPQLDRRTILWELQRNGGNMATTTERILAGRIDTVSLTAPLYEDSSC